MTNEELEKLIRNDSSKLNYSGCDANAILKKCKIGKTRYQSKLLRYFAFGCFCVVLCFVSVLTTVLVMNGKSVDKPIEYGAPGNVDMGKSKDLSRSGLSQKLYDSIRELDPDWEPIFDQTIAWGPEQARGMVKYNVIDKSNLLSEEDKATLLEYEKTIKKRYPNHDGFQIGFGIKDNKDYIFLVDYIGYDIELGIDVNNMFVFESNLPYSFESIVDDFETLLGMELTDEFLNDAHYDFQGILETGIIIGFLEIDEFYQEYYMIKLNGEVYVVNK